MKLLILAIIMVAASLFCALSGMRTGFSGFIPIVGIMVVIFFGLCLAIIFKRLIHPKALLVINRYGITDNPHPTNINLISWKEIRGFGITNVMGHKFISIELHDITSFIEKVPAWKAKGIKANIALGYPPISYTVQTAECTIDEVLEAMKYFHTSYQDQFGGLSSRKL